MKKIILILAIVISLSFLYFGFSSYKGEVDPEVIKNFQKENSINKTDISFHDCVKKGGDVLEIYPRECSLDGKVFNEKKDLKNDDISEDENSDFISLKEISKHNSVDDCWIIYNASVYDVTKFLPIHPGGVDKIAQFCGTTEFQRNFEKKHGKNHGGEKFKKYTDKKFLSEEGLLKK